MKRTGRLGTRGQRLRKPDKMSEDRDRLLLIFCFYKEKVMPSLFLKSLLRCFYGMVQCPEKNYHSDFRQS